MKLGGAYPLYSAPYNHRSAAPKIRAIDHLHRIAQGYRLHKLPQCAALLNHRGIGLAKPPRDSAHIAAIERHRPTCVAVAERIWRNQTRCFGQFHRRKRKLWHAIQSMQDRILGATFVMKIHQILGSVHHHKIAHTHRFHRRIHNAPYRDIAHLQLPILDIGIERQIRAIIDKEIEPIAATVGNEKRVTRWERQQFARHPHSHKRIAGFPHIHNIAGSASCAGFYIHACLGARWSNRISFQIHSNNRLINSTVQR